MRPILIHPAHAADMKALGYKVPEYCRVVDLQGPNKPRYTPKGRRYPPGRDPKEWDRALDEIEAETGETDPRYMETDPPPPQVIG